MSYHISPLSIPISIFFAVMGQIYGSQWRSKTMSESKREEIDQIPNLNFRPETALKDKQVIVALLNMGGPRKNKDVKDFQKHLFTDPLLIRFPLSFLLQKTFAWILIKFRCKSVEAIYQKMGGGSPIYASTIKQAKALREELTRRGRIIDVTFSFNYSPPFPYDTISKAKRAKKDYLLPLSLYPHFSKATTGSNIHYLKKSAANIYPSLVVLDSPAYFLSEGYIQAFVDRIYEAVNPGESLDDYYLLFSAHGLPQYFLAEGDPYPFQIAQTISKITDRINRKYDWVLAYQSSVGPLQWLKPSTEVMIHKLYEKGVRKMIVIPISFVGDHIETICEINDEYRLVAENLGYEDYRMTKAIESHPGFIASLADAVESVLTKSSDTQNFDKINSFNQNGSFNKKEILR